MAGIFISYRREDSQELAGRLFDRLAQRFGKDRVFRDMDAIDPGAKFAEAIAEQIGGCDALVALIGKRWLDAKDVQGRRRLDLPNDVVKAEIAEALAQSKLVIPVLIEGTPMPPRHVLPPEIASLADSNALSVSDSRFDFDVRRLVSVIGKVLPPGGSAIASQGTAVQAPEDEDENRRDADRDEAQARSKSPSRFSAGHFAAKAPKQAYGVSSANETIPPFEARVVPHDHGVRYDADLSLLIFTAAKAGLERGIENAVNYTTLLIGFAFCPDPASRFLQGDSLFKRAELLASRGLRFESNSEMRFVYEATETALPQTDTIYSPSARRILNVASDIAADVGSDAIGPRHLLAAFLFFNPSDHDEDLRRWGLDSQRFANSFPRFVEQTWPRERWEKVHRRGGVKVGEGGDPTNGRAAGGAATEGGDAAEAIGTVQERAKALEAADAVVRRARYIATFGADYPSLQRRDLLDVKDEARAFARIAASANTRLPLSIGVFGEWGSGKTFYMGLMAEHVEQLSRRAVEEKGSLFLPDIVQIKFNAWHYIETNLWASLVEYIFSELDRKLQGRKPRDQVERLFEQLSTSRLLKLEAVEELIVKRRERKEAEERLDAARRDYEGALLRQSSTNSPDFWKAVYDTFKDELAKSGTTAKVEALAGSLGLNDLSRSAQSLNEVLKEAETEAGRARVLNRAMLAKLGQGRWIVGGVLALIVFPAAVVLLKDWLGDVLRLGWIRSLNEGVLALSGLLAAASAVAGKAVHSAKTALMALEGFRGKLDAAVKQRTEEFKKKSGEADNFAAAERELARLKNEFEQAERKFAEADKRSDEVLREYHSATARGRLNAFIRDKLASGDYAKHLGLIATIRKDFEQLSQLMAAAGSDHNERDQYSNAHKEYLARLGALLDQALKEGVITQKERIRMGENTAAPPPGLFTRIILYIDDLDRCPPDKVVDVLQAIHLLLYFPLFVVVVAVDARWVSRSLRDQFPHLLAENIIAQRGPAQDEKKERSGTPPDDKEDKAAQPERHRADSGTAATSYDYLEKIFQIPYWVRPMDNDASMKYVKSIVEPDIDRPSGQGRPSAPPRMVRQALPPGAESPKPSPSVGTAKDGQTVLTGNAPANRRQQAQERERPAVLEPRVDNVEEQAQYVAHSMRLTEREGDLLEALAPFVGSTPRRGLRFVNIYRLVKTSLPEDLHEELSEAGFPLAYRALITQLAIVTGAPHLSWTYFRLLEDAVAALKERRAAEVERREPAAWAVPRQPEDVIAGFDALRKRLDADLAGIEGSQKRCLLGALDKLREATAKDVLDANETLLFTLERFAPVARRYSFTARPH
jgi:TIR domain/KAP family P-loop domain